MPWESPRFSCEVLLAERSAADTSSRESRVASEVCFTEANISFAFSRVLKRPSDPDARYSARESRRSVYWDLRLFSNVIAHRLIPLINLESPFGQLYVLPYSGRGHSIAYSLISPTLFREQSGLH